MINVDMRRAFDRVRSSVLPGETIYVVNKQGDYRIHAALVAGLADGSLHPVIGRELSLAEAPQAHRAVLEPGAFGKIVLKS